MNLNMKIHKIKAIENLIISLPVDKGLYAITGQNGSGKSTVITCASAAYFNMKMNEYFGKTEEDSCIGFELAGCKKEWRKTGGRWNSSFTGYFELSGFYEGSIIFGNRFRNTKYDLLMKLDRIDDRKLTPASDFIRKNLGKILHNNEEFYDKLFSLNAKDSGGLVNFDGDIFYYQKNEKRVSQFHMSTGENLLISVLNSVRMRNESRKDLLMPCLVLLDEIELALHPSSLKRLVVFLRDISNRFNYAIYFSTHSIELISAIVPENIFFLDRHADNSIEILNPCYPAYATRMLYDHDGYDYIILVEDDLAREVVRRVLRENSLINNKLVHVLPCGGYTNVIDLAHEVISSNLVGKLSKISIILDRDVKDQAEQYIATHTISNNIPLNYLPIESLEKFLKANLVDTVDHKFFRTLNDLVFHQKSLNQIVDEYRAKVDLPKDKSGKKLYEYIDEELRNRGRNRSEIVEIVMKYLLENKSKNLEKLVTFLKGNLE